MELLRLFWENLLPVFLAAGAGYVLAARMQVPVRPLSHVGFYVFSPCLVFQLIVENHMGGGDFLRMAGFAGCSLLLLGGAAFLAGRLLRLSRSMIAALVLLALLPNSGNYGLSVNLFAFGQEGLAQASLYFVTAAILSYTVGVFVASSGRARVGEALSRLARVPTVWAVPLAFLLVGRGWSLPSPAQRTVDLLAGATIPTFLVILGMQLRGVHWKGSLGVLGLGTGLRLGGGIAVALGLSSIFGLDGVARQAATLQSAMPTAVITTILATEYDTEPAFVTMGVLTTTLLSPLSLTVLLRFLGA